MQNTKMHFFSFARRISCALILCLILAADACAQGTAQDYARAEQLLPWNFKKLAGRLSVDPHWIDHGDRLWYRVEMLTGKEFWLVDPTRRTRIAAFDHAKLASSLSQATGRAYSAAMLPFNDFEFVNDGHAILVSVAKKTWSCDLQSYQCIAADPRHAEDELPSPDGRWVAFCKNHNLYVRSTVTGEEFPLTTDGVELYDYGSRSQSDNTWVSDKIAGKLTPPVAVWSPDSTRIVSHRLDQRNVGEMYLVQSVPPSGFRPLLHTYRYPLAGDANLNKEQLVLFDVVKKSELVPAMEPLVARTSTSIGSQWVQWSEDGSHVYFLSRSRGGKSWSLGSIDAQTGTVRKLLEETGTTYVEPCPDIYGLPNVHPLVQSPEFIIYSERDGWGHLYLYDASTGTLKNQITKGTWQVRDLLHVDEAARKVYFVAAGREPGGTPYYRRLYRINLDGSGLELLSPELADHDIVAAPGGNYFLDTYSRVDLAPKTVVRSTDGQVVLALEEAEIEPLKAFGWKAPESFTAKAADGVTDLYGVIYRPSHFDPSRKYAVLEFIYPGPQVIATPQTFWPVTANPGTAAMAELGFIVIVVDGRGTPFRSKAFHDFSYGKLGQAGNLEDHMAVLRQLAARYAYLDLDRVGIYGHSAGGFASTHALLTYPDFYKVAVSSSGDHDNRVYRAGWGETYQGLAIDHGYVEQSNVEIAANLKGKLLLIHGEVDDNVSPANTMRLVNALVRANKDFDLLILPNRNHSSVFNDPYVVRRRWDYFVQHLLGIEPPRNHEIKRPLEESH
jgi:dipeptidyl-peptidase-4